MQFDLPQIGFHVDVGPGPHPTLNCWAVNVWLTPTTPENAAKMRRTHVYAIQGALPIDPETAKLLEDDPFDPRAERVFALALREPLRRARLVNAA